MKKKLIDIIRYAKENVEYYADAYLDISIDSIVDSGSIESLPLIEKDTVRLNTEQFISKLYDKEKLIVEYTSGSTGKSLAIYKDRKELVKANLLLWKSRQQWIPDINITQIPVAQFYACNEENGRFVTDAIYRKDNYIYISLLNLSERSFERYLEEVLANKSLWILGPPSAISKMASYIKRAGNVKLDSIKYVEMTGELVLEEQRKVIEEVFPCTVANHYGAREFWGIAYECQCKNLHVFDDYVHVEIVDSNGNVLPYGEVGEVVVTGLEKYAMPLIRYKLGDRGRLLKSNCECGRQTDIIEIVGGRITEHVITNTGESINPIIFAVATGQINILHLSTGKIDQFQIIQDTIEHFTAKFVVLEGTDTSIVEEKFLEYVRKQIGDYVKVEFVYMDEISQDEKTGKFRYFYSKLSQK